MKNKVHIVRRAYRSGDDRIWFFTNPEKVKAHCIENAPEREDDQLWIYELVDQSEGAEAEEIFCADNYSDVEKQLQDCKL